ncbi:MAG: SDR family oxidoreductase [Cytophagales bacterium]|nr:SDR family oxidoreductase [Cytophagales bacterium]
MTTVLILGATSEVALALADQLAAKSFNLILAARHAERLNPVKADLTIRFGVTVTVAEFDAAQVTTHADFYAQLSPKPDAAICVFGFLGDHEKAIQNWEECATILTSNFVGAVSILNIVANDFENRKAGVLVGVSSVAGERGRQSNYFYGSAKAGFTAYLSGLRNRLFKSSVHVVTVKPGFIRTRMIAGIPTPGLLTASADQVARKIIGAMQAKRNVIYIVPAWRWIMLVIRSIPESIFKRLRL